MVTRISQITSAVVCGPAYVGKWTCSAAEMVGRHEVRRYLQADGTWGKITYYFDTRAEVVALADKAPTPIFELSEMERQMRDDIVYDIERGFDDGFE